LLLVQLVDALSHMDIILVWPHWVESCTFVSHLLLAVGSSVNILLYCSCDKRFFVVVQKTLKSWFVWPLTATSADNRREEEEAYPLERHRPEVLLHQKDHSKDNENVGCAAVAKETRGLHVILEEAGAAPEASRGRRAFARWRPKTYVCKRTRATSLSVETGSTNDTML
jgi:hypothetical protein